MYNKKHGQQFTIPFHSQGTPKGLSTVPLILELPGAWAGEHRGRSNPSSNFSSGQPQATGVEMGPEDGAHWGHMVEHDPYMIHFRATFFWTAMFGVQREGIFYGLYVQGT